MKVAGEAVRLMKEASKAAPGTHSKEDLDAAVQKLLALKKQLPAAPAPPKAEEKVSST